MRLKQGGVAGSLTRRTLPIEWPRTPSRENEPSRRKPRSGNTFEMVGVSCAVSPSNGVVAEWQKLSPQHLVPSIGG